MSTLDKNIFRLKNKWPIIVILLNGEKLNFSADKNSKLHELFSEVCDHLKLEDNRLFGLTRISKCGMFFLDLDMRISSLSKKIELPYLLRKFSMMTPNDNSALSYINNDGHCLEEPTMHDEIDVITLYFQVRFYVPNHCLHGKVIRHLYYKQLKWNVLRYGLLCSLDIYFQLAAYALQAELNCGFVTDHKSKCTILTCCDFRLCDFFPVWMIQNFGEEYLLQSLPTLLKELSGVPVDALKFRYIRLASDETSNFNQHLYKTSLIPSTTTRSNVGMTLKSSLRRIHNAGGHLIETTSADSFQLGVGPRGFHFHYERGGGRLAHINTITWSHILKLSHKNNCFLMYSADHTNDAGQPISKQKHTFYMSSSADASHIFNLVSQMHLYQTTAQLSAVHSAQQLETLERRQYKEAYVYSEGEILTTRNVLGDSDMEDTISSNIPESFLGHAV